MADQLAPAARRAVSCRDGGGRKRPRDREVGIVECDPQIFGRIMGTIDPITDIGGRCERLKAVQKSLRHIEVDKVGVVKPDRHLVPESRRARPDVDNDILNGAIGATDEFGFTATRTAVHAADRALHRTGLGILEERRTGSRRAEVVVEDLGIERSGEEAPFVEERLGHQNDEAGDVGLPDLHGAMLP